MRVPCSRLRAVLLRVCLAAVVGAPFVLAPGSVTVASAEGARDRFDVVVVDEAAQVGANVAGTRPLPTARRQILTHIEARPGKQIFWWAVVVFGQGRGQGQGQGQAVW